MHVLCTRCGWEGAAKIEHYPSFDKQTTYYDEAGDKRIVCPKCGRAYFYEGEKNGFSDKMDHAGYFYADRPLVVMPDGPVTPIKKLAKVAHIYAESAVQAECIKRYYLHHGAKSADIAPCNKSPGHTHYVVIRR